MPGIAKRKHEIQFTCDRSKTFTAWVLHCWISSVKNIQLRIVSEVNGRIAVHFHRYAAVVPR